MVSRQTLYHRQLDQARLRSLIPSEVPLLVFGEPNGFRVQHLDGDDLVKGARYEVAYAVILGFLRASGHRPPVG